MPVTQYQRWQHCVIDPERPTLFDLVFYKEISVRILKCYLAEGKNKPSHDPKHSPQPFWVLSLVPLSLLSQHFKAKARLSSSSSSHHQHVTFAWIMQALILSDYCSGSRLWRGPSCIRSIHMCVNTHSNIRFMWLELQNSPAVKVDFSILFPVACIVHQYSLT